MSKTILFMAGGTGGHVIPALTLANRLREMGYQVAWLGTPGRMEAKRVPEANIPFYSIDFKGVRGKQWSAFFRLPFTLSHATYQAIKVIRNIKPDLVVGMGGYVTFPGALATKWCGTPLVIHEQNAIPGMANRILRPLTKLVMSAFPNTFSNQKVQVTGNPIRDDILNTPPYKASPNAPLKVLVFGGSMGAKSLNQYLPQQLKILAETRSIEVLHQAGQLTLQTAQNAYENAPFDVNITPFIENMGHAYAWADIVICRAGALSVSEIAAAGRASILVPYPHAVDQHQHENARILCDAGAAILVEDNALPHLDLSTLSIVTDEQTREHMADSARSLSTGNATETIVSLLLKL